MQILEQSTNSIIIELSDTEIGKVLLPSTLEWVDVITGKTITDLFGKKPTLDDEITALQYANHINDLMPKFIKKQTWQAENGKDYDMIVMERLYLLPYHHYDLPTREAMFADFENKMIELHDNHFVHADLMRPTNYYTRDDFDWMFKNIVQTKNGLRLIDAGFSTICKKDNIKLFVDVLFRERKEIGYFKKYYFSC